jgi:hypothetical protein
VAAFAYLFALLLIQILVPQLKPVNIAERPEGN